MSGKKEVSIKEGLVESIISSKSPPSILKAISPTRQHHRFPLCYLNSSLDGRMYTTNHEGCNGEELSQFSCSLLGDKLYFFGGCNKGGVAVNSIFVFDVSKRKWYTPDQIGATPSKRRAPAAIAIDDRRIFVHGGYDGATYLKDAGIALAAEFETSFYPIVRWEKVSMSGDAPSRRCAHSMAVLDNKLYLFGGTNKIDFYNGMHVMKLSDFSWKVLKASGTVPHGRINCSLIAADTSIYCFGGYGKHSFYRDLHMFNLTNNTWTKIDDSPHAPHSRKPMGIYDQTTKSIYFFFGGPGIMSTYYTFDTDAKRWNAPADLAEYPSDVQAISPILPVGQTAGILIDFGGDVPMDKISILQLQKNTMNSGYVPNTEISNNSVAKYFNDDETTDVAVEIEGRAIKVHKIFLIAASKYFKGLFFDNSGKSNSQKVEFTGCSYQGCYDALKYLYTGTLSGDCSFQYLLELFSIADRYEFPSLLKACEDVLKNKLNSKSICQYLITCSSSSYKNKHAKKICFEFIKKEQQIGNAIDMSGLKSNPELLVEVINFSASVTA